MTQVILATVLIGTTAVPPVRPFVELAFEGGVRIGAQTSTEELRNLCYLDAERELQECRDGDRENCTGVYEQDRRVCLIRYPEPPPQKEARDNNYSWYILLLACVAVSVAWAAYEETKKEGGVFDR